MKNKDNCSMSKSNEQAQSNSMNLNKLDYINPIVWLIWGLDFFLYVISIIGPIQTIKLKMFPAPASIRINTTERIHRHPTAVHGLATLPFEGVRTVFNIIQRSSSLFKKAPAFGIRKYIKTHTDDKKISKVVFGETEWFNYEEVTNRFFTLGSGLRKIGMLPVGSDGDNTLLQGENIILLYENTCADWLSICLAAFTQALSIATCYSTLPNDSLFEALKSTNAKTILCNFNNVSRLIELAENVPTLKNIVYTFDRVEYSTKLAAVNNSKYFGDIKHVNLYSIDDLEKLGSVNPVESFAPQPDTTALIMYTSGSTGTPKGISFSHREIISVIGGILSHFQNDKLFKLTSNASEECYLAYLPAAHILEFIAELAFFSIGGSIGFACPRTLTSQGAIRQLPDGSWKETLGQPYPPGAIQEFRPSIFAVVPKVMEIFRSSIQDTINRSSPIKCWLFKVCLSAKLCGISQNRSTPLLNLLVFNQLRSLFGGRLKGVLSGGGAFSASTQNFMRAIFNKPVIQGYGLTETSAGLTIQSVTDSRTGTVGGPIPSIEVKLTSCQEVLDRNGLPYLASDTHHLGIPCLGRGQVCARGPHVFKEYFKNEKETSEAFSAGNWFETGDIAYWSTDGSLFIVDRIKNLVKLRGGEYIALEAMETAYSRAGFINAINGGICCYGDHTMDRPIAIVQIDCNKLSAQLGLPVPENCIEEKKLFCSNPGVVQGAIELLNKEAREMIGRNELLRAVILSCGEAAESPISRHSPWTPANGLLTHTNKISRRAIHREFEDLISEL